MKRTIGIAVALAVVGAAAFFITSGKGGGSQLSQEPRSVMLPANTQVELVLLQNLDAGGSKVGEAVRLGVLKDVKVDGMTVIPKGSVAVAEVTKSRGASLLNAVSNTPARLEITLNLIEVSTAQVPIAGNDGNRVYPFTQANTGDRIDAAKIDNLWNDPAARQSLVDLAKNAATGQPMDKQRSELKILAERLGLERTGGLAESPGSATNGIDLASAAELLRRGDTGSLTGFEAVLAAQTVGEIAEIVSSVDHKLRGIFKGRTIRATMGTPVLARTSKPVSIPLQPK